MGCSTLQPGPGYYFYHSLQLNNQSLLLHVRDTMARISLLLLQGSIGFKLILSQKDTRRNTVDIQHTRGQCVCPVNVPCLMIWPFRSFKRTLFHAVSITDIWFLTCLLSYELLGRNEQRRNFQEGFKMDKCIPLLVPL